MPLVATKMKPSDFLEIEDALDHNFAGDALALSSAEFFWKRSSILANA